jgi:hypothetical protein
MAAMFENTTDDELTPRCAAPPNARQLAALDAALSESSLDRETQSLIRFSMQPFS